MFINFSEIISKYGKPKGVIHIGAHLLEEREEYIKNGLDNTIWIEANPEIVSNLPNLSPNEVVINHTISDIDDMLYTFNITNNGQSSSILDLELHKDYHPHIFVTDTISVRSKRMDTIIEEWKIDIDKYDFLNVDIQGAELLAIKSFGSIISNFKFIYTEINTNYLYKDCALVSEIDEYLSFFGFKRLETHMTDTEWGDALYVKVVNKKKIPEPNLIFDIGGHKGSFTDKCITDYPNAKIIIVEANETLYDELNEKYIDNKNVVVLHYLVSDKIGFEDFYICESDQISTASLDWVNKSRFSKDFNWDITTKVQSINLDSMIKIFGQPSLIKIDVEGYELNVVSGLSKKVNEICFEWTEEEYEKINLIVEHLTNIGYESFGYIYGDNYLQRPEYYTDWSKSEIHKEIDISRKEKWGMIWCI